MKVCFEALSLTCLARELGRGMEHRHVLAAEAPVAVWLAASLHPRRRQARKGGLEVLVDTTLRDLAAWEITTQAGVCSLAPCPDVVKFVLHNIPWPGLLT